ncbi:gem-associated protein 6 isoform X3 [Aptenodytes patagonicus]|uniref:gem-associated protein 6 isoform X3 n=1 Tax=Aptenodytes patagonicus TaxID=9234 RepID=UPI003FA07557
MRIEPGSGWTTLIHRQWKGLDTRDVPVHRAKAVLGVGNMNDWQRKSPLDWETYVNKMVKVAAIEKHEYEGWVLTVDPVSASIVLATFLENEKVSISVVLGHAVQEVEILKEGDDEMKQRLSCIFAPEESKAYSPEELEKRKNNLKTWLETNHIPVTEQEREL